MVKDLALSLLWRGFSPWPGNFHMGVAEKKKKSNPIRSSPCGSTVMNPTSIHEDSGSIPGPAQWVQDLALP